MAIKATLQHEHPQQVSTPSLCITFNCVGLYPDVPQISNDQDAAAAYTVEPPSQTQTHDLIDSRLRRGSLYILDDPSGAAPNPSMDPTLFTRLDTNTESPFQFGSPRLANVSPNLLLYPERVRQCEGTFSGETVCLGLMDRESPNICPKRIRDHQARILYPDFVELPPPELTLIPYLA
ncbi:hypothetical protein GYMLUDRAFT_249337 [Collybiopsis luxurians FD-317 M1]|uniref:Uncharacterized protein n=1 Tax=Collybiopsis luxurians FD-317 M1 TaxID=944289 RepID=A0A0D0C9G9_9AGAR|nr:hypothetical protein GYMLUDRAFT_249337 [Collybiopsis luxurians FD-317 M1]